jgi:hypothetical protein
MCDSGKREGQLSSNRRLALIVISFSTSLVLVGCGLTLFQPTPVVVTQEVTRLVVVTATPTPTSIIKVITVTVIVAATPATEVEEMPSKAVTTATVPAEQLPNSETVTSIPDLQTITSAPPEVQSPTIVDGLDDPVKGLLELSEVAKVVQSQGIHTLRLTMDLSVPIELTVRDQGQVDESLTNRVRSELHNYDIYGNYIIDISVDDLAQQKWVIEALGGVVGLEDEEILDLRQNGDKIWEKPVGGEWSLRDLPESESVLPLGGSLAAIDSFSHALNLSDLVTDALRPLLLARNGEHDGIAQNYSWTVVNGTPSISFVEIQRTRESSSSDNLKAIAASLANSGVSVFVDPAAVANGIERVTSVEKAWLNPDTRLVDHSQVEVHGSGVVEVTYLMQQKMLDATLILNTSNSFEYLPSTTVVGAPEQ